MQTGKKNEVHCPIKKNRIKKILLRIIPGGGMGDLI
jgi:hypothetical protein